MTIEEIQRLKNVAYNRHFAWVSFSRNKPSGFIAKLYDEWQEADRQLDKTIEEAIRDAKIDAFAELRELANRAIIQKDPDGLCSKSSTVKKSRLYIFSRQK